MKLLYYKRRHQHKSGNWHATHDVVLLTNVDPQAVIDKWNREGGEYWDYSILEVYDIQRELTPDKKYPMVESIKTIFDIQMA